MDFLLVIFYSITEIEVNSEVDEDLTLRCRVRGVR
jgi:hypothetical protein